jgi:hypothetical protein
LTNGVAIEWHSFRARRVAINNVVIRSVGGTREPRRQGPQEGLEFHRIDTIRPHDGLRHRIAEQIIDSRIVRDHEVRPSSSGWWAGSI